MTAGPDVAWREYARTNEDELVRQYLPLARRAVRRHFSQAGALLGYEDLDQEAAVALLEAIRLFDPSRYRAFQPFAIRRVRWRVLNYIRRHAPARRRLRDAAGRVGDGERRVGARPDADAAMVAGEADVPVEEVQAAWAVEEIDAWDAIARRLGGAEAPTEDEAISRMLQEDLGKILAGLPGTDRTVLALYWKEELTYAEIGRVLGVSATAVYLRHKRILRDLAAALGAGNEGERGPRG
jgi:RNA polymerase sigma factor for flagellar operon FliA